MPATPFHRRRSRHLTDFLVKSTPVETIPSWAAPDDRARVKRPAALPPERYEAPCPVLKVGANLRSSPRFPAHATDGLGSEFFLPRGLMW